MAVVSGMGFRLQGGSFSSLSEYAYRTGYAATKPHRHETSERRAIASYAAC